MFLVSKIKAKKIKLNKCMYLSEHVLIWYNVHYDGLSSFSFVVKLKNCEEYFGTKC